MTLAVSLHYFIVLNLLLSLHRFHRPVEWWVFGWSYPWLPIDCPSLGATSSLMLDPPRKRPRVVPLSASFTDSSNVKLFRRTWLWRQTSLSITSDSCCGECWFLFLLTRQQTECYSIVFDSLSIAIRFTAVYLLALSLSTAWRLPCNGRLATQRQPSWRRKRLFYLHWRLVSV